MTIKILIVDNDKDLLILMQRFLMKEYPDIEVVSAVSAQDSLRRLEMEHFDAIVCDFYLGPKEMNGLELLEWLRNSDLQIPFIMFTGRSREEVAIRALNLGADFYLKKDVDDFENLFRELIHHIKSTVETRQIEDALAESEERFRSMFESAPIGVAQVSPDGRILEANASLTQMLKFEMGELVGLNVFDLTTSEDEELERQLSQEMLQGLRDSYQMEKRFIRKDGRLMWGRLSVSVVLNKRGEPIFTIGMVEDVTELKREREALRESEARFRALYEEACIGITITVGDNIVDVNPAYANLLGYSREELSEMNIRDISNQEDHEIDRQLYIDTIEQGLNTYDMRKRYKHKDGSQIWVDLTVSVVRNEDGDPTFMFGMVQDVTEQVKMVDTIKENEQRFRELFDKSPIAIELFDSEGNLLDANTASLDTFGLDNLEGFLGFNLFKDPNLPDRIKKDLKDGQSTRFEIEFDFDWVAMHQMYETAKTGKIHLDILNTPLASADGSTITGYLTQIQDISERKIIEKELVEQTRELELIFNSVPAGIWYKDTENNFIRVNKWGAESVGMTSKDLNGRSAYDVFPEHAEQYYQDDLEVINSENPKLGIVEPVITSTGEQRWMQTDKVPLRSPDGTINGLIAITTDITERKEAEERYQTLFNTAPIALAATDSEGRIIDANQSMLSLTGYMIEELKEKDVGSLYANPEERIQANKTLDDVQTLRDFEAALVRKNGTIFYSLLDIELRDDEALVAVHDITDRKNAEEALKDSEERFRSVFENMLNGYAYCQILIDDKGKPIDFMYLEVNDSFEKLTGLKRDDVVGKRVTEAIPGIKEDTPEIFDIYGKVAQTGEPTEFEIKMTSLDRWFKVNATSPRRGYFIAILDNITERKKAEEALKGSEERFRSVFEESSISNNLYDSSGIMISVNQAGIEMFGASSVEDLLGFNLFEDPNLPEGVVERILAGETVRILSEFDFSKVKENNLYQTSKSGIHYFDSLIVPFGVGDDGSVEGYFVQLLDVTEHTEAQKALRESENQFRTVFENAGIGMTIVSTDDKLTKSNPAMMTMLGYNEEEMAQLDVKDFSHPRDMEKDKKLAKEALVAGTDTYQMEKRFFHKDGSIVWGNLRVTIVMGEDDSPTYFIGMVEDITARKRTELALSESEEKYRSLFDYSPYPIVVSDIETGKIVDFNDKTLEMLGYTREEFQKIEIHEFDALEEEEDVAARLREIKETGGIQFESKHITKNKEIRDVLVSTRLTTPGDKILNQAITIDITDQKRTKENLKQSEEKYRVLFEKLSDALFLSDKDGHITLFNDIAAKLFGYDSDELLGMHFTELLNPQERKRVSEIHAKHMKTGENIPGGFEVRALRKDGSYFDIHLVNTILLDEGMPIGYQTLIHDITEIKKAEQALIASEQRFKELIEHSNEVFYIHDLDDKLTYVSPQSVQVFGYSPEEMMVKWTDLTTDNPINERGIELTNRARETGEKQEPYVLEALNKRGKKIMIEIDESPQKDASGEVIGLVGMVRDITKRKQAEDSLKESESRFRGLFEKSPIGIELYDKEGMLIDANQVTLDIFGVSSVDDVKGINLFEDPNLTEEAKDKLRKGEPLAFQAEFDFEVVKKANLYRTSKSGTLPMDVIISPMILEGGDQTDAYIVHVRDISDRKLAENSLRDSEKKLRDFFRNAQIPLFRTDLKTGVILDCNNRAADLLGYDSPRDMIRKVKAPDHYIDPDSRRMLTEELTSEGEVQIYETQLKKVSGEELFVEISATNYPLEGYVESAVIDITEKKAAEMALKESEANFKSIFEQAAVGVAKVGLTGSIIEANSKLKQMLGYDEGSLEGVNVFEITTKEDSEIEKQLSNELIAGKRDSYNMEKRFFRKDGSIMRGRLTVSVSRTNLGDIDFTIGVLEDITERKQLQEILRLSEEKFRSIVENAGVGITIVDLEDHILDANKKYLDLVGYSLDELKQMTIAVFTHPEDAEKDSMLFAEVKERKRNSFEMEKRYIRKDGEQIWVHLTTSVVRNINGEINLIIGIIEDITDRQEAFELIQRQRQELSDFAHMISHDLNNNFIKLRLMLNELETEDNRPQTDKIGNLLIDMSDLTKHSVKLADAGISIGARNVVDLEEIMREAAELHVPSEIEFKGNYSLVAKADETKISQVLVNILENAVVHGRPTKIVVTSAIVTDGVNLTIANDGIQIPPEIRPKIFDYGFSSEEVRRGLGLAYVKKLVEAHGWTITLRDTQETAFVIWIPNKDLQIGEKN